MNTENNKIIAEFMGESKQPYEFPKFGKIDTNGDWKDIFFDNQLKFHSDWNWLMEVVEKIEQTTIKETYGQFNEKESNAIVSVDIENKFCQILSNGIYLNEIISENGETKIKTVYNTCLEFIKNYNEQNKM
mgnify:CR=1 FL=1